MCTGGGGHGLDSTYTTSISFLLVSTDQNKNPPIRPKSAPSAARNRATPNSPTVQHRKNSRLHRGGDKQELLRYGVQGALTIVHFNCSKHQLLSIPSYICYPSPPHADGFTNKQFQNALKGLAERPHSQVQVARRNNQVRTFVNMTNARGGGGRGSGLLISQLFFFPAKDAHAA